MSNIFFTSDQHYYHKNILKFQPHTRGVATEIAQVNQMEDDDPAKDRIMTDLVQEMNEKLIKNHNSVVGSNDTVYYIGDFSFGGAKETREIIRRLNGNKIMILGNHDKVIESNQDIQKMFSSVHSEYTLKIDKKTSVFMHHFPFHIWNKAHHGMFHLHGHCHGGIPQEDMRRLDIGVDNRPNSDMMPFSWDEVYQTLKNKSYMIHHSD